MARIVIAEDVAEMRAALALVREGAGHTVELAPDGEAALALHRGTPADLIVLDIWMPGTTGLQALKTLREAGDTVPVVIISGGGPGRTLENATHLADLYGAASVLYKPFEDEELVAAVAAALAV